MKKILITGGCGFVGVNLVRELLFDGGYEVTLLDDLSNAVLGNVAAVRREVEARKLKSLSSPRLLVGDIRDRAFCEEALKGHDAVIHLAAYTRVVESLENPSLCFDVNIQGTINLLESCRRRGIRRFIFASSNAASGDQGVDGSEAISPRPLSPYGAAKLTGEALCSAYCRSFGMDTVALRFTNAYGRYCERKSSVVAKFMRDLLAGKPLTIYGDGRQTRDFIHVSDLCRAICISLATAESSAGGIAGDAFQIATGVETSILDLIGLMAQVTGVDPILRREPARPGEITQIHSNPSQARERLGFTAQVRLREGIEDLYRWFQEPGLAQINGSPQTLSVSMAGSGQ